MNNNLKNQHADYLMMFIIFLLILSGIGYQLLVGSLGRKSFTSIIYIGVFLYFVPYKRFQKIALSPPMLVWILLSVFHVANALIKHVPGFDYPDVLTRVKIYCSIVIFTYLLTWNLKKSLNYIFYTLMVWLALGLYTAGIQTGERLAGEGLNAVQFGKNAAIMAICGLYLSIFDYNKMKWALIRIVYPLLFIFLSQTRQALGMVAIQTAGFYYSYIMRLKFNLRSVMLIISVAVLSYVGGIILINSTHLGDRFLNDFERVETSAFVDQYKTNTVFDYIAGERIIYYAKGWEIVKRYPLTGIGLNGYKSYTQGVYPMHVEWMVHLAEGGIITFILYIIYLSLLFYNIKVCREDKYLKAMMYFTLIVILFSNFFASSYGQEIPVLLYSFTLSARYYRDEKKRLLLSRIRKLSD